MENQLFTLIQGAGIVGAGGAGFPTHVKVKAEAEYVIVNGAECEPLLRVDQQLMACHGAEVLSGLRAVVGAVKAKKGIIALKKKYTEAIEALKTAINAEDNIELFLLDDFYPAGDEQVTVYEVLKRIVPEGGIPLQVNTIVINVETLLNIHGALEGRAVTHKYVTVTGAVRKPVTLKLPIGITYEEAIQLAGGPLVEGYRVIDGGPMMGRILDDIQGPITKTTKGIIILPQDHPLIIAKKKSLEVVLKQARAACCHCSLCTEICPRNLLGHGIRPDRLMRIASYGSMCEAGSATEAFLCCECGLCEQACVMGLQPWKLNGYLKSKLSDSGIKNPNKKAPDDVNEFRSYRKFPVKKLIARLGLTGYQKEAPLEEINGNHFERVAIKLKQHIGAAAEAVVLPGDLVKAGQVIALIKEGQLGSTIHASIDGRVEAIDEGMVIINKI